MDLNELSAEELVSLAYELQSEMEKEASAEDSIDLNELSAEELVELAAYLEEDMEKEAGEELDFDLNELSAEDIVELAYHIQDDMEKEASENEDFIDINELSVDEFMYLAGELEEEMEKEAMMAKVRQGGRSAARVAGKISGVSDIMAAVGKRGNRMARMRALLRKADKKKGESKKGHRAFKKKVLGQYAKGGLKASANVAALEGGRRYMKSRG